MDDLKKIYMDFEKHLMTDKQPSHYFNQIFDEEPSYFSKYPFDILTNLKEINQSLKYHPEGNVWNHTMLVIDHAAIRKNQSNNPKALMWAALLHDIGKVTATKIRKGRITAYNHDKFGENLSVEFLTALEAEKDLIHLVSKMVRWHMQILFVVKKLPFADIKAMLSEVNLEDIALLSLCDRLGRGNMSDSILKDEMNNVETFISECKNVLP